MGNKNFFLSKKEIAEEKYYKELNTIIKTLNSENIEHETSDVIEIDKLMYRYGWIDLDEIDFSGIKDIEDLKDYLVR